MNESLREIGKDIGIAAGVGVLTGAAVYGGSMLLVHQSVERRSEARVIESCANTLADPFMNYDSYKAAGCEPYFGKAAQVDHADQSNKRYITIQIPANLTQINQFKSDHLPAIEKRDAEQLAELQPIVGYTALAFGAVGFGGTIVIRRSRRNKNGFGGETVDALSRSTPAFSGKSADKRGNGAEM